MRWIWDTNALIMRVWETTLVCVCPFEYSHVFGGELGQSDSWENQRKKRERARTSKSKEDSRDGVNNVEGYKWRIKERERDTWNDRWKVPREQQLGIGAMLHVLNALSLNLFTTLNFKKHAAKMIQNTFLAIFQYRWVNWKPAFRIFHWKWTLK